MPKQKSKGGRRRRGSGRGNKFVLKSSATFGLTVASGNTSVIRTVDESFSVALTNVGLGFEFYRFTKLNLSISPVFFNYSSAAAYPTTSDQLEWAIGYLPETTNATSTTITVPQVKSLPSSIHGNVNMLASAAALPMFFPSMTQNSRLNIRKSALMAGPVKCYRTQAAITGDPATIQGSVIFALGLAAVATTVKVQIRATFQVEFSSPVDASGISLAVPRSLKGAASLCTAVESKNEDRDLDDLSDALVRVSVPDDLASLVDAKVRELLNNLDTPSRSRLGLLLSAKCVSASGGAN